MGTTVDCRMNSSEGMNVAMLISAGPIAQNDPRRVRGSTRSRVGRAVGSVVLSVRAVGRGPGQGVHPVGERRDVLRGEGAPRLVRADG